MALSFPHLPAQEVRSSLPYPKTVEETRAAREGRAPRTRRGMRAVMDGAGALRRRLARTLALWHLTSLDAPTVAVVWSAAFAWAAGVRVPAWTLALQALAVWVVYVGDRLLDARRALDDSRTTLRTGALERLRERHFFHWRNRRMLVLLATAAACVAAALILIYMPGPAQERSALLAGASLVYFARVHGERWRDGWRARLLTKETVVGVLFTLGCALPALGRLQGGSRVEFFCSLAFFALLAWLNCAAIERWEGEERKEERLCAGWALAGLGIVLAAVMEVHARTAWLLAAGAASAVLLEILDGRRERMRPVRLRAMADLVLLTPLVLLFAGMWP